MIHSVLAAGARIPFFFSSVGYKQFPHAVKKTKTAHLLGHFPQHSHLSKETISSGRRWYIVIFFAYMQNGDQHNLAWVSVCGPPHCDFKPWQRLQHFTFIKGNVNAFPLHFIMNSYFPYSYSLVKVYLLFFLLLINETLLSSFRCCFSVCTR